MGLGVGPMLLALLGSHHPLPLEEDLSSDQVGCERLITTKLMVPPG